MGKTMTDKALTQITKLIPMLSSDQDGEVVAAARAIGRTLKSNGFDWHDFAARFAQPQAAQSSSSTYEDLRRSYEQQRDRTSSASGQRAHAEAARDDADWYTAVSFCVNFGVFTDKEYDFVHDMHRRIYAGETPTDRQGKWLGDLYWRTRFQRQQRQQKARG